MKYITKHLLLVILVIGLMSFVTCNMQNENEPPINKSVVEFDQFLSINKFIKYKDSYLLEGDVIFSANEVNNLFLNYQDKVNKASTRGSIATDGAGNRYVWSYDESHNLSYNFSFHDELTADDIAFYRKAFTHAAQTWMNVANIRFFESNNNPLININISKENSCSDDGGCFYAFSPFPHSTASYELTFYDKTVRWSFGDPGDITIDVNFYYYVVGILTHEIGHLLGLCHEQDRNDKEYMAFQEPYGLFDKLSIMYGNNYLSTWELSAGDIDTIKYLYPADIKLTVSKDKTGTGSGLVISSKPTGIIYCGGDCVWNFKPGSEDYVILSAVPDSCSLFAGWSGPCSGTGDCLFWMTESRTVIAKFDKPLGQLTVNAYGNGTGNVISTPGGINWAINQYTAYFAQCTTVTLSAIPSSGTIYFDRWTGAINSTSRVVNLNIRGVKTAVTATFNKRALSITVNNAGGMGTVTSPTNNISCQDKYYALISGDIYITLTANPNWSSRFAGWSGDASGTNKTCTIRMNKARSVTAVFTP